MIKYGLIGLIAICCIVTLYQLYLSNSWTSMIKNKQKEYTITPSIQSNTKPLIHRLEACAVCLVCTIVLPTQITSNKFMAPESASEDNQAMQSVMYDGVNESVEEKATVSGAPKATTSLNKNYLSGSDAVFNVYSSNRDVLSISLEMLNPNAEFIREDEFLDIFVGKDLVLSNQSMISSSDYIVRVSGPSFDEKELLLKIEDNRYIICDSIDEVCYVIDK